MDLSEPDPAGRVPDFATQLERPFPPVSAHSPRLADWVTPSFAAFGTQTRARWALHLLLLLLTLATTTAFGCSLALSFAAGHALTDDFLFDGYRHLWHGFGALRAGLAYSLPLLLILLAHEFGHYFTCRHWGVEASLPYFGPAPTLLGTVGAFIRIRSPIYSRRALFDIGVSGPLAGFVALLPFLIAGVLRSRVVPASSLSSPFHFGTPLLLKSLEAMRFPGVASSNIVLHPMAMAAWAGMLATAINLFPVGQLDGGHISYAVLGERGHRLLSLTLLCALLLAGFFYWPWWLWAAAMFFFRRHPLIYDRGPLGDRRGRLAAVAVILFVISICIVPVR